MNTIGWYVVYENATGKIIKPIFADENSVNQGLLTIAGQSALFVSQLINIDLFKVENGALVEKVISLDELKEKKVQELAFARQEANLTSFTYNNKEYSATQTAQNDLNAIANYVSLFNALPASFPNAWQATDGSVIPIADTDAFKPLYSAMVAQGATNFIYLQTLLSQVQQASTKEELDLVQW